MSDPVALHAEGSGQGARPAMTLPEHLDELRKRIFRSVAAVAVGAVVCWFYHEALVGYMQRPIVDVLRHYKLPEQLVYLNPTEPFNLYLKISILAGLFLTSPFVLYQVWLFISPGLYRREKRYVGPFLFSTVFLFTAGGYFGYRIVYPQALNFLIHMGRQFLPMITIHEYTDLFLTVILGLGLVFEMPILVFFLAGALAPTPDITSMCVFAAPMLILYALSIGIAWFVHPTLRKAREARR